MNLSSLNIVITVIFTAILVIINLFYDGAKSTQDLPLKPATNEISKEEPKESTEKKDVPVWGIVQNVEITTKGIQHADVTIFEIKTDDGKILYSGIDTIVREIKNGYIGEFYLSNETIVRDSYLEKNILPDGSTEYTNKEVNYLGVKKYKIYGVALKQKTSNAN